MAVEVMSSGGACYGEEPRGMGAVLAARMRSIGRRGDGAGREDREGEDSPRRGEEDSPRRGEEDSTRRAAEERGEEWEGVGRGEVGAGGRGVEVERGAEGRAGAV